MPTANGLRRRDVLRGVGAALGGSGLAGCLSGRAVESATFVHRIGGTAVEARTETTVPAAERYRLMEGEVFWATTPVEFVVGHGTVPASLDEGAAMDAIDASLSAWNAVDGVPSVFSSPATDSDLGSITEGNGTNELVWAPLGGDALGRTHVRWTSDDGHLVEADVELDATASWTTNPDGTDAFDVRNILTHEFGHSGLADVTEFPEQTMYHTTSEGETRKRTLGAGDEAGWRRLYG